MRGVVFCGGAALLAAAIVLGRNRAATPPPLTFSGDAMGTRYTVSVVDLPHSADPAILDRRIREELDRIDALMSTYRPESELSRFNRRDSTEWFAVSRETAEVVDEAIRVGRLTGGAFDVTVDPLVRLWDFGPERKTQPAVPPADAVRRALAQVGFADLEVRRSPPAIRKSRANLAIDLSGIAKGFAVDQVAGLLRRHGAENYLVEIGGELRAAGRNPQGTPWQIAVASPRADAQAIQRVVGLENLAMATSGDYRNYFEASGRRYSHIIDPRSGMPVCHKLASVTVLADSCMRADALATGLMVLGPDAGYELALRERLPALLVVAGDAGFVERETPDFTAAVSTGIP
jgi:thiamine biosynthesis lipoprotein